MDRDRALDVAVTGMAARLPGVADMEQWWKAILSARVLIRRLTRDELLDAGVPAELADAEGYVPVRGVLADADRFDHRLFGISARDAELMDPQHRLMLEVAWSALEDSGLAPQPTPGAAGRDVAVYASGSGSGYLRAMLSGGPLDPLTLDQALHGTEPDFIASLISYKLGLTGPALGVQTACSSSLVAVHLATQALLNGECDTALVVAAGIDFPQGGHLHVDGGIQSSSGMCRPFDERSDGVVAGSGVVALVLRRLADLGDDPEPYGVLLGTAVNNDGSAKAGYYAPSVTGQEAVIRAALAAADVPGSSIGYLEAHATGTRVGDPIEWAAASAALAATGAAPGQVAVGALKATMGHLDAASGLAAVVKAMRVVRDGVIPAIAGFTALNPLLDTAGSPLRVPAAAEPWTGPLPRRAGVSSFGIGGTNAHVVIEAPERVPARAAVPARDRLIVLSAGDPEALDRTAERVAGHLRRERPDLADVATTLAAGRAALPERLAVVARDSAEAARQLDRRPRGARGRAPAGPVAVAFLLPGQGSQRPGMAAGYTAALPGFATALDECLAALPGELAVRLHRALFDSAFPAAELAATELAQPALFAVGYAAGRALTGLGVRPCSLLGHSLGEIAAACLADVLDLADAARFVAVRGRAMQACPPGAMVAVGCDPGTVRDLIAESGAELTLAAVNGPASCTVAGTEQDVERFRRHVGDRVFARRLHTSHAFHSRLMEPALPELAEALAGVPLRRAATPLASNLTGEFVAEGGAVTADSLVEQARRPVLFGDALAALARTYPHCVAVEVGPGQALATQAAAAGLTAVPLDPGGDDDPGRAVLAALGKLWTLGVPVPLQRLGAGEGRRIHLPGYAFHGPRLLAPEVGRGPSVTATPRPAPATTATAAGAGDPDPDVIMPELWAEVLGQTDLDGDADFFALGGDSLLITQLARRIHGEFGVRVPLRDMLAGRTLSRQTALVRDALDRRAA
ncbi:type I polyketide synthase [Planosporangium sp. 12N6]|uniref:type I polyketide synthase n=1 Tax=Planosporangium spinosum TaxID=3402278 RepID=UPI003CE6E609